MTSRTITVFVCSSGDVHDERAVLDEVVRRLAYDPFVSRHARLRLVSWDNPAGLVPLLASEHPQTAIDSMLPRPSQCDIVVGIFWSRLGTPLPPQVFGAPGGTAHPSGTAWEIDDALATAGRPGAPAGPTSPGAQYPVGRASRPCGSRSIPSPSPRSPPSAAQRS
jgi:hypothetical protein